MADPEKVWYVNRSMYETGHYCPVKRYQEYHSTGGFGIKRAQVEMPLATGGLTHHIIEDLNKAAIKGHPTEAQAVAIINKWCHRYHDKLMKIGFVDPEEAMELTHREWRLHEQAMLGAGLGLVWWKYGMEEFFEQHEIISVEQEYPLPVQWGVPDWALVHEIRPDLVVRRNADKRVLVPDFKTEDKINEDAFSREWVDSIQMAVQCLGVEAALGEQVSYSAIALEKGLRRSEYNSDTKEYDGPRKQQSPFCYMYFMEGQPPMTQHQYAPQWKYRGADGKNHTLGKLWDKHSTWDMPGWDGALYAERALEVLNELEKTWRPASLLTYAGPYQVNRMLAAHYLESVATNEEWWFRRLLMEDHTQESIFKVFPASFKCTDPWGRQCSMHKICFRESVAADDPVGSGEYVLRAPHHQGERLQMEATGIKPPVQWDSEEETTK